MRSFATTKWQIVFPDDIFDQITVAAGEDRERYGICVFDQFCYIIYIYKDGCV